MPKKKKIKMHCDVKGSGHFKSLTGEVVDQKESGFGMRYALVRTSTGQEQWANENYLTRL